MSICTAPIYKLEALNNLFIEMTSKNCNQRCSKCYIDFPISKCTKDFIPLDSVKECLFQTKCQDIHCIYLTGAEPMTHPDFNTILRLCLKRINVCICTNASFLNEKKIRFLKKVEDEGQNQIFFRLSLTHYDENLNDKAKYRGNFRQNILALKILSGYNFESVLSVQNFYNLPKEEITQNFSDIFAESGIKNSEIQISASYPVQAHEPMNSSVSPDCTAGRVLCNSGIYACPFLANDYRGRVGASFKDYSKSVNAETDFCTICLSSEKSVFAIG